jgi:glycosyltransferase involved in cell wall biosynthesis
VTYTNFCKLLGDALNILMLAPEPFFEARGTPISVYLRLQLLSGLGHNVTLLTYHIGQAIELPGVRVFRIPGVPFIRQVRAGPSWAKPLLDLLLFALAFKHLLTGRYDALHTHEEAAILGMVLAALFRKPHIYDMHSSLPRQFANFRFGNWWPVVKLFELLERWVVRTCQAVIVVGSDLEEIVRRIRPEVSLARLENLPVQACGISLKPEAVAAVRSRLALGDRPCIVYAGTFEAYQGLDLLLESAILVARDQPASQFILVGGRVDQVDYWRKQVSARNLQDHVAVVGAVPLAASLAYLETADILVSPRRDGTSVPLKIYSYLQAGKPVVATRSPAHTQVLSDATAILVDATPESMAAGILRLTSDAALREAMGARARALALEKFSLADQLATLSELYRPLDVAVVRAQPGSSVP